MSVDVRANRMCVFESMLSLQLVMYDDDGVVAVEAVMFVVLVEANFCD